MSGHGSLAPEHVCACDTHPAGCPCPCYGCRCRAVDAGMRAALGVAYRPIVATVRAVNWLLRAANKMMGAT